MGETYDGMTDAQRRFAEWEAYIQAHSGEVWQLGKVYVENKGWCPIWKVGDKALQFNVADARIYQKHVRTALEQAVATMDEAAKAKMRPEEILAWFADFETCTQQCMTLNSQGAIPKALGGTYEEPLSERQDGARAMASLMPDGSEGNPAEVERRALEALAALPAKDCILQIAAQLEDFYGRLLDGGTPASSVAAGVHLALTLLVLHEVAAKSATDDDVLAFFRTGTEASLPVARMLLDASAAPAAVETVQ